MSEYDYNFGALQHQLPDGYRVIHNGTHYQGLHPDGSETVQHWSPHVCLRWCREHAEGLDR